MFKSHRIFLGALIAAGAMTTPAAADADVNIYSYRQPFLIQPLLDAFTKKTGIKTNIIFAKKGLIERVVAEGANSPADLVLTVDIGRLDGAKVKGITQAVSSEELNANIPGKYRDPEGHWFGLTTRARIIYASKDRVTQPAISYEELADPKWKGRICTRSGQHVYTIGLIAAMIAHHGQADAEAWLTKLRDNLARTPNGNDRAQVKAIFAGECDIALGNSYYMGKMLTNKKNPEQKDWANSVRILFPNSAERGTHVNLSGVFLAKNAPNRDNAIKLMEFLSAAMAQELYAQVNYEYPVKDGVAASDFVSKWGDFKADDLPLADIAKNRKAASEMVDRVGFNDGPSS